jgi:hypothetical protein
MRVAMVKLSLPFVAVSLRKRFDNLKRIWIIILL